MIDLESIQNHSRVVQEPPGHQTTSKTINLETPEAPEKLPTNDPKTHQFEEF